MKKLFLLTALAVFGLTANAQDDSGSASNGGFKAGINLALPIGDAGDISTFSIALDLAYLWEMSEQFDLGIATGFSNAFGDSYEFIGLDTEYDDVQFIPIAAAGRFNINNKMYAGADIGYAIGINDGNDGGFYYRPRFGYSFTDLIGINASYTGISMDGSTWSTIGVGVEFSF